MTLDSLRERYAGQLITAPETMEPFLHDWRRDWEGAALAVAQPANTEEVAAVVRWCVENRVAIVPQGGNTGLSGGAIADASGNTIVLSMIRMNRIRHVDGLDNSLVAEAGCTLVQVQDAAKEAGAFFPLSLGAEGSCTIGGNLATNAGGTGVLRYGMARNLCLGLEVVTAQGEIWNGLRALHKDNTGYDLRDLFIGSEGTLGIITAAVLKLFPPPQSIATAFVALPNLEATLALFARARGSLGADLTGFELISEPALGLVLDHIEGTRRPVERAEWYVLVEAGGREGTEDRLEQLLAGALEAGEIGDAAIAASKAQVRALWHLRETIAPAQTAEGSVIKLDVSVPISKLVEFLKACSAALRPWEDLVAPIVFGHVGDGNLHYDFSPRRGSDPARFKAEEPAISEAVHDLVARFHGSVSAEHGLGVLRRDDAARYRPPVETDLQLRIKTALDPLGLLNPGKVLPPAFA